MAHRAGAVLPPRPSHASLYKQLRGAYGLSRFGACVRLFFLMIAITFVLTLFTLLLLLVGVLG